MKYFIVFIALTLGYIGNAQESIEKIIDEFETVKVYDLIHVKMVASDDNKVIISGENINNVEVENHKGILKIKMNVKESFDGNDTSVTLYYTKVDVIDANEGAIIKVTEPIVQYEIDLNVQEGGKITANLETTYANFKAVTGGSINVKGSSKNQDISIYTGGVFKGKDFITEKTEVSIKAAGEANINATASVNAKVKAGGTVYIYGNPEQVDESTILGGKIKRM